MTAFHLAGVVPDAPPADGDLHLLLLRLDCEAFDHLVGTTEGVAREET